MVQKICAKRRLKFAKFKICRLRSLSEIGKLRDDEISNNYGKSTK